MTITSEKKLQPKIIKHLEQNGFYTIKTIKLNKNGLPDIIAFKDGNTIMVEVKSKGKKPSELQNFRIKEVIEFGVGAFWCDSFEMYEGLIKNFL